MKATIFDIKHFAVHDGDGIRTTVFFKGCSLKCLWCHNPEGISRYKEIALSPDKCILCGRCADVCERSVHSFTAGHSLIRESCSFCGRCEENCPAGAITVYGKEVEINEILPELLEDREFYESSGGGVTLSGGECLLQADFCQKLLMKLKERGIHTAIDTCGFVGRSALDKVIPHTDLFLYDIKAINDDVHKRCTGFSNKAILDNLIYLDRCGKRIEIRVPLVPGYNDGEIEKIAEFTRNLKNVSGIKILPYHKYAGSKYDSLGMENTLPDIIPSELQIKEANWLMNGILEQRDST